MRISRIVNQKRYKKFVADSRRRSGAGFTMIEMVIILGIIVMISSVLLANFPGISTAINLQRSSQQLALEMRKAQSMALAIRQVDVPGGLATCPPGPATCRLVPWAFGVSIANGQSSYVFFADLRGASNVGDGVFTPGFDYAIETVPLVGLGTRFTNLMANPGAAQVTASTINITFGLDGLTRFADATGVNSAWQSAEVDIQDSGLGAKKSVTARSIGQISIQ